MGHATAASVHLVPPVYFFLQKDRILPLRVFLLEMNSYLLKKSDLTKKCREKKSANSNFVVMAGQNNLKNFLNSQFFGKGRSWEFPKFTKIPNFVDSQIHVR